ncbi:DUF4041 domain-containing protein [Limosilactobacillus reuteri]|uniref:DUF4041 domain-containing protein n=1 Tax=Limosilactobacillus reuteri TaxID=1598 RepID=UPI001E2B3DED|nr:DUF4041 domain-containing protein [Limosilactobacillus reuteri]MCC4412433.1 DUF4041 domain-containing protein [Limosilactobacillus reuteri]MCC4412513.1 DUF4041 domain-containing protein [Limosilactobacillus reuteri]
MKRFKRISAIIAISFLGFVIGASLTNGSPFPAIIGLLIGWGLSFFWPVINPKKFREEIKNQAEQISKLEAENKAQKEKLDKKMTILQMKPEELNNLIKEKQSALNKITNNFNAQNKKLEQAKEKIDNLNKQATKLSEELEIERNIQRLNVKVNELNDNLDEKQKELNEVKDEIISYDEQISIEEYGLYTPHYSFENSIEYKNKLAETRKYQKEEIKNGSAAIIFDAISWNGSSSAGHKIQLKNIKQLIRTFNIECEAAINKATYTNMPRIEKRIKRSFEQLNKLNTGNGVELTQNYLQLKLDELHLAFEYAQQKEEEKEKLREEREKEREEKKVQAELAKQRKAVEKERAKQAKHFEQAQALLKEKMENVNENDEKYKSLQEEVAKLKSKLSELDKKSESLDYRENHATAGYVYIISNIGSFGQNVFKIGVTRRLEPLDRIRELSSASVPFKFDVHALIFSEDAYKLEANLHNYFDKQRVNKVNNRKEFFSITIEQIHDALDKYYNRTFEFREVPEAEEYRKSLEIAEKISA